MNLPGREVEHYPVAVTVEAAALAWLRERGAPHGAVVVADTEIAARTRRGEPWAAVADALRAAVIVRPVLPAASADLLWAHALLAAADASQGAAPWWPEALRRDGRDVGMVRVSSQLGPGRVESAVLTFRLTAPVAQLGPVLDRLEGLLAIEPAEVAAAYRAADPLAGRTVRVDLLPRGSVRGTSRSIDERGELIVEGAGGRSRRFGVDSIAALVAE